MTALVAKHINLNKSSSKGWKQCTCCPYGYHIDLDFVRYCENVANSQLLPRAIGLPRRPKKRASMDILLGLPNMTNNPPAPAFRVEFSVQDNRKENDRSSPGSPTWDGLEQAVEDFELTLQRASKTGHDGYSCLEGDKEMKGDWINFRNAVPWRRRALRRVAPWDDKDAPEKEQDVAFDVVDSKATYNSAMSQGTLQTIRQQVASSLSEIKRLEEEVKQVPILQDEITRLKNENVYLTNKLNIAETNLHDNAKKIINEIPEKPSPKKRNIAVGTSIITRDVGVSHKLPLTANCAVMTDHYEPPPTVQKVEEVKELSVVSTTSQTDKYYEISLSHRSSQTDLKMDTVYSSDDLERNIDKAIKLYEKTFYHLLHPKKPLLINSGVQVDTKSSLCRDYSVQVRQDTCNFGAMFKPITFNNGVQTVKDIIRKRDIGVSDDTIYNNCKKCTARKMSVGTNTHCDKEMKLISLSGRSKSFDHSNKKTLKSTAVGPDKSMCSSKSTDTMELNTKKDVAVNTTKNKLVDTAIDPMSRPPTSLKRRGSGSKIPRPVNLPVRSRSFNRQETYLVSPSPSRKSYGSESFDYESGSEEGGYSSSIFNIDTTISRPQPSEPLFHPIRVTDSHRVKKEFNSEIRAALKTLNEGISNINEVNPSYQTRSAKSIVQQEWFKISSVLHADHLDVEDSLDYFEEISPDLLKYIINMVDDTGNTAMHYAVSHGNFDVVSSLLDSKVCDVNKRNAAGYTCIMLVSLAQVKSLTHRQVVRRLFQLADVNIRAKQHGQTALMLAVSHGRMDMVELLLDSGADINIQDEDGCTALMCAAENGHIDITKFLLAQSDCDLTITDCDGNTALNIAMEAGNRDLGVLLYAQQHFSRGGSPYTSFKSKKPSSSTPTRTPVITPTSPLPKKI